jgi:hypothetical protein
MNFIFLSRIFLSASSSARQDAASPSSALSAPIGGPMSSHAPLCCRAFVEYASKETHGGRGENF